MQSFAGTARREKFLAAIPLKEICKNIAIAVHPFEDRCDEFVMGLATKSGR